MPAAWPASRRRRRMPRPSPGCRRCRRVGQAAADRNPIDVTLAGLQPALFRTAINALLDSPSYDALVIIVGSSALAQPDLVAGAGGRVPRRSSDKPVLAYRQPARAAHRPAAEPARRPAFAAPESCATACWRCCSCAAGATRTADAERRPRPTSALPTSARGPLNEAESKALFARFGVPVAREIVAVATAAAAEQAAAAARRPGRAQDPLARRSPQERGRRRARSNVSRRTWPAACEAMLQPAVKPASPARSRRLPGAGAGPGRRRADPGLPPRPPARPGHPARHGRRHGRAVQGHRHPAAADQPRRCRLDGGRAEDRALLDGFRGRPRGDVDALVEPSSASPAWPALGERLVEAEINPVFVLPEGQGVRAADGLVVLR